MASNQRKRSLDFSTRDSLSALEKALEMSYLSPLRDNEFTSEQYIERARALGQYVSDDACRCTLKRLVQAGKLNSRKIKMNGSQCNAYSTP